MAGVGIGGLVDLGRLQKILEDFSEATGLATVAVDTRGIPVTRPCAFTEFCQMMRSNPERNKLCHGCDAHGGLQSLIEGTAQVYRCHSGLVDFGLPITGGDGTYVGAILCGQVRMPETEQPRYLTAGSNWYGDPELKALYEEVPVASRKKIRAAVGTLLGLAREIEDNKHHARIIVGEPAHSPSPDTSQASRTILSLVPAELTLEAEDSGEQLAAANERKALLDALAAEDLTTALGEVGEYLDDAYADPDQVRPRLVKLEELVLAAAAEYAPRQLHHLGQVVARHRRSRSSYSNRYSSQVYFERLLITILDEVVRCRPRRRRGIRDLLNDIARDPCRAISLADAANAMHWSPGHLSKLFKSVTGCTFVSYVTARRISRARLMLASTQLPVQKVAAELDFNQVNYFSRVFRAYTGMSPSEYRRQSVDGRPGVSVPAHHFSLLRA